MAYEATKEGFLQVQHEDEAQPEPGLKQVADESPVENPAPDEKASWTQVDPPQLVRIRLIGPWGVDRYVATLPESGRVTIDRSGVEVSSVDAETIVKNAVGVSLKIGY